MHKSENGRFDLVHQAKSELVEGRVSSMLLIAICITTVMIGIGKGETTSASGGANNEKPCALMLVRRLCRRSARENTKKRRDDRWFELRVLARLKHGLMSKPSRKRRKGATDAHKRIGTDEDDGTNVSNGLDTRLTAQMLMHRRRNGKTLAMWQASIA